MKTISEPDVMIEEIWHTAPLLAYVEQDEQVVEAPPQQEQEEDWPLDPAILHGLVHP